MCRIISIACNSLWFWFELNTVCKILGSLQCSALLYRSVDSLPLSLVYSEIGFDMANKCPVSEGVGGEEVS